MSASWQFALGKFSLSDVCQVKDAYASVGLGSGDIDCDGAEDNVDPDNDGDSVNDGPDNCNADEPIEKVRDELVENGVTVNGLPVNEGDPQAPVGEGAYRSPGSGFDDKTITKPLAGPVTLEQWYRSYVMGGVGSFVLPANGYADFGRAMRQKFVIEVSGPSAPARFSAAPLVGDRFVEVQSGIEPLGAGPALEANQLR